MRAPPTARTACLVWAATRVLLLLLVFHVLTLPGPDVTTDVSVIYRNWYEVLRTGSFPLDDVTWQYPPGAALPVLAPALLPFLSYPAAFFVLALLTDAAVFAALLRAGRGAGRSVAGAWVWVAGVPLLGPTAFARYDVMVTAVAVAALLTAARHPRAAGALAAFGALLKVWPALILVGTPRGRATRAAWLAALATGVLLTALFTAAMPGALDFLTAQRDRGVEVESLGALVLHVARQFGWEGEVRLHYGSMEFLGPHVEAVAAGSLVLTALAFGWLLWWRLRARRWTAATPADAAFTAVLLFTTTSRVLSPQYLLWLVGLAAVCLALRSWHMRGPALLVLAATFFTLLEFPLGFGHVVASDAVGVTLLVVRNGLLVAASLLAGAALWRSTVTAGDRPEPGPGGAGHGGARVFSPAVAAPVSRRVRPAGGRASER
ncbi:glycosyltransferase family 87 protein [Streptomyces sp. 549]|uniref:glycosyltransferase family 87 protein n=1 Tax=Streptomyces sp. 549 TaxID=3049076 RepID=UPI0024C26EBA|nr:glycosyltransferase family 87 protein [Streptomyces sp. 549]MDK1475545.1 glycosyltransferase family 87 protein [Streptomyces sp. 549]